jgi:hypothetical protein
MTANTVTARTGENADREAGNTQKIHNTGRNARKRSGTQKCETAHNGMKKQRKMKCGRTERNGKERYRHNSKTGGWEFEPLHSCQKNQTLNRYCFRTQ